MTRDCRFQKQSWPLLPRDSQLSTSSWTRLELVEEPSMHNCWVPLSLPLISSSNSTFRVEFLVKDERQWSLYTACQSPKSSDPARAKRIPRPRIILLFTLTHLAANLKQTDHKVSVHHIVLVARANQRNLLENAAYEESRRNTKKIVRRVLHSEAKLVTEYRGDNKKDNCIHHTT